MKREYGDIGRSNIRYQSALESHWSLARLPSSSRVDSATMNRSRDSAAARDTDHSNRGISIRAFRRMARKTPCHRGDRTDNRRDSDLLGSVPQRSRSALSSSFRKAGEGNFLSGLLPPGALLGTGGNQDECRSR